MNFEYVDIEEVLAHEGGTLLYCGAQGRIVQALKGGAVLTDIEDEELLLAQMRKLKPQGHDLFCAHNERAADALARAFALKERMPCAQWVYTGKEPPQAHGYDIRPLPPQLVPAAAAHYHLVDDSEAYFAACVAEGKLWGAFRQGRLAGFVGLHNEGSIGMLEVFADSRRLGIGYCLEAFVIGYCLKKGRTPYAQVVKGNEASMALQKKLGMQQCKKPAIWLY